MQPCWCLLQTCGQADLVQSTIERHLSAFVEEAELLQDVCLQAEAGFILECLDENVYAAKSQAELDDVEDKCRHQVADLRQKTGKGSKHVEDVLSTIAERVSRVRLSSNTIVQAQVERFYCGKLGGLEAEDPFEDILRRSSGSKLFGTMLRDHDFDSLAQVVNLHLRQSSMPGICQHIEPSKLLELLKHACRLFESAVFAERKLRLLAELRHFLGPFGANEGLIASQCDAFLAMMDAGEDMDGKALGQLLFGALEVHLGIAGGELLLSIKEVHKLLAGTCPESPALGDLADMVPRRK